MLEKYFIHAKKKKDFLNELNAGNILEEAVVFIENTKEIYHKGVYYNCKSIDISGCVTESQVQNIVLQAFDELSTVAFSGSYNDLINKPTSLPNPNSLVIKKNGVQKVSYTGSSSATADITGDWYGTSYTSASTAAKSVSCSNYTLTSGERIAVKFTYANTASNPTLNVDNKGAKSIYWNGSALPSSQYWSAGAVIEFLYDGSYYHMLGAVKDADTTITVDTAMSASSTNPVQNKVITDALANKVDKVTGKGLSTNDYTTTEKNKLAGIAEGAEVNVQSDWNATSGDAYIKNKPSLATVATSGSYNDLSNKPIIPVGTIVDTSMSTSSTNPVQNKVVTAVINGIDTRVQEIEDFFDEGAKLNLTIKSNQGTDSTISAVKATIEYDGQSVQAGSGVIGLPVFTDIKITFPDVEGYKTPAPLEFTTGALPVVYEVTYETELVNVTVTAWDGTSVVGQIITINGTQYTWDGTTIQQKVPFGTEYKVSGNSKDGYMEPEETFTASLATRNVGALYSAMVGSWITLNQTITDPATMISGDVNGEDIQLIRNNSHRYLGKYTAEGTMTVCQLDDTDSTLYADGSAATLSGAEGDVFMKLPKFYYIAKEKATDIWEIGFYYGNSAPTPQWKEWDGNDLIGAYKGVHENGKLYSISDKYATSQMSKNALSSSAQGRGIGFSLTKVKHINIMAILFYAQYGHMNSQATIGTGYGFSSSTLGQTNSLGMEDTVGNGGNGDSMLINFWGLEAWWGVVGEIIDNATCKGTLVTINEGEDTRLVNIASSSNQFLKQAVIGEYLDILPKTVGASATTGFCDGGAIGRTTSDASVIFGHSANRYNTNTHIGVAGVRNGSNANSSEYDAGGRLSFRGNIVINNNSATFKSLTAIG